MNATYAIWPSGLNNTHSNSLFCAQTNSPSISRKVQSATAQLNASQAAIINTSHSIRLILDDLKAVSEKIDIITSCQILPDINISSQSNCSVPSL